ncbi:MAG: DUF6498-containing protein [Saprospiraceae bacterium]|nr:DUF6498-containing protein [Saprospiraceae bacterium]
MIKQLLPSIIFLSLVNLLPIFGVVFLGWSAFEIILMYCLETIIIGGFNVFKMLFSGNGGWMKVIFIPFFMVHFNMFAFVQTLFVILFFAAEHQASTEEIRAVLFSDSTSVGWFLLVLGGSHLFSFLYNYLWRGEYKNTTVNGLMISPYGRIFIQQFTVIFGGALIIMYDSPLGMLVLLVILKTILDLIAHIREHKRAAE